MSYQSVVKQRAVIVFTLAIGLSIGFGIGKIYLSENSTANVALKTDQPLYWVAPMDDNYRRDKPGKSPMGMDLVPYYGTNLRHEVSGKGEVHISPNIVNNLGIRTGKVKLASLNNQINTVGLITFNEDKLVHIHPRIAGWVEKLYVKATGNVVEKGQPLYELYSPELVNAQEEYLLTLSGDDERLIQAAERRLTFLHIPKNIISEIKTSGKVKQSVVFNAPQSGIVKDLNVREGFYVELGTRLFSIGDLSEVWVEAEVFERQYREINSGDKVLMSLDYLPEHTWQGEVDYLHPILDQATRSARVRLRFDNPDYLLKPNMFAQVTIERTRTNKSLLIPKSALISVGKDNRVVLALGEGSFKSISVEIGKQDAEHVEVLTGLDLHDEIVFSGQFLIDSESSKTSDFIRMESLTFSQENQKSNINKKISVARVKGVINHIDIVNKQVNISHEAISKWQRPAMTMDFVIGERVDLDLLTVGATVNFTFSVNNGDFIISQINEASTLLNKAEVK